MQTQAQYEIPPAFAQLAQSIRVATEHAERTELLCRIIQGQASRERADLERLRRALVELRLLPRDG